MDRKGRVQWRKLIIQDLTPNSYAIDKAPTKVKAKRVNENLQS